MPNRLAQESSPYLLQHANNPVDWYAWDREALERAKNEDKPIFLSIGYSACHWCHVMEHESFEDPEIAGYLNEHFINIKVDREERPDLDQIYMQAVMAMCGHGGWPLSAFLTPNQEMFYGGTYWPPQDKGQMPGFNRVIRGVVDAFENRRDAVMQHSSQITQMLRSQAAEADADQIIDGGVIAAALNQLLRQFDSTHGGFGRAPKFPHPMDLTLLLKSVEFPDEQLRAQTPPRDQLLHMAELTLQKMAGGGIFDHLAGGFARYSVDERWLVPHFEKMLYDNAQLACVYLLAFRLTGNKFYADIVCAVLDYLLADMTDAQGGIHSTEDADSEGEEGKFYVWSRQEVMQVLGEETGARFCRIYDVSEPGNFEGKNILNLPQTLEAFAHQHQLDPHELQHEMHAARAKLLHHRSQRIRPGKDDKILVSWNALAIDALARAAIEFKRADYAEAALAAANFIWQSLRNDEGRLLHTWRNGTAKLNAYLDDYAYLIVAFQAIYRMTLDQRWIDRSVELADTMIRHFADTEHGGFYFTADDHEALVARTKDLHDSSVPSGNSMAALALLRLSRLTGNADYLARAESTIRTALPLVTKAPMATGQMLVAIDEYLRPAAEYIFATGGNAESNDELIEFLQSHLAPEEVLIRADHDGAASTHVARLIDGKFAVDRQPTLYVCQNFTCQQPVVGQEEIRDAIKSRRQVKNAF